ncbi:MAG: HlyD family efflux transporter periplasmic adaptor subunit [Bacteroidales bacterium]|nr:HlyD family efflux transporter periplasmic adaptor subunit [Bacteroidales bacterium]
MDKPVSKAHRRKTRLKQLRIILPVILIPILVLILLKNLLTPSINLDKVVTGTVDKGNLEITVQGSGIVIPNYEEIITSPFRANVVRIMKTPGVRVETGDTLLVLNNELAMNELDKLNNELQLKEIQKEKLKIQINEALQNFKIGRQIKEIRIENLKSAYDAEVYLHKIGGSTPDVVKKTKTEWDIARLELEQAIYNHDNQINTQKAGVRELETEMLIHKGLIAKARNLVNQAYVKSPFAGSLSSIINQPGIMISEGQEIARVADLSRYKIKGNVSNSWAGKVLTGQSVLIKDRDLILKGTLENIMPSVSEGMMECQIRIDDGDISNLRPNQQLEIRVVVSFRDEVLRLPNGTYYKDHGNKVMYVIRGNKAYRTNVVLGEASFDYVEVVSGLEKGDQVILTDISEKEKKEEIKVTSDK